MRLHVRISRRPNISYLRATREFANLYLRASEVDIWLTKTLIIIYILVIIKISSGINLEVNIISKVLSKSESSEILLII